MIYRVVANLAFDSPDEAQDFYHDCRLAIPKAVNINPHQPNEERCFAELQRCYHDETPTRPCDVILREEVPYPP